MHQTFLADKEPLPIPEHHKFRQAWKWPHAIEYFFRMMCEGFLTLNVCCGQSTFGDVRVDIDPDSTATIIGDMNNLPFANCSFPRVVSDPFWKTNIFQRFRPFYELVRVCEVGGYIYFNATWIPFSKSVVETQRFSRCDFPFGLASVICEFKKITDEFD